MTTKTTFAERLAAQLRGEDCGIVIYWDDQDASNPGPAYRDDREPVNGSGQLDFVRWSAEAEGYNLGDYFPGAGLYAGPDQHGVYPVLTA